MNHLTPKPPSLWMQSSRRCEATATNWKSSQPHNPALHCWRLRAVTAAPTVSLGREMSAQHITIKHHSLTFLTTITPHPIPPQLKHSHTEAQAWKPSRPDDKRSSQAVRQPVWSPSNLFNAQWSRSQERKRVVVADDHDIIYAFLPQEECML